MRDEGSSYTRRDFPYVQNIGSAHPIAIGLSAVNNICMCLFS